MKEIIFVTGNAHKAKYFSLLLGLSINHKKVDVPEIQSLDPILVVTAKAKAAYDVLQQPVIVEDTSLVIHALGKLPGTFIKWFLDELGTEKLCRLADSDTGRRATASCIFAYYDGVILKLFCGTADGTISTIPLGKSGFGWNTIFMPLGQPLTLGQMSESVFKQYYLQIKRFPELRQFIESL